MSRNKFAPRIKYRLVLYNVKTGEKKEVSAAGRDFVTKTEADTLIKSTGAKMAPWVYIKEVCK